MNKKYVFGNNDSKYNLSFYVDKKEVIKEIIDNDEYDDIYKESTYFYVGFDLLISMAKIVGLEYKRIKKIADSNDNRFIFLQNDKNLKLVINGHNKTYMMKKFVSKTNECDYEFTPGFLFDLLIEALKDCGYKLIEYNFDYFIKKDKIISDFEKLAKIRKYNFDYMIERSDYFDINLFENVFRKYINGEVDEEYFCNFFYLMMLLAYYHPNNLNLKKQKIYESLENWCDGLAFGIERYEISELTESYVSIKYLYNELHNIKDDGVIIYYKFNHFNHCEGGAIYEVGVLDKLGKTYWMGYIKDPVYDFDNYYVDVCSLEYLNNDEEIIDDEDDENGNIIIKNVNAYFPDDYYEKYNFDENLWKKYFKKVKM